MTHAFVCDNLNISKCCFYRNVAQGKSIRINSLFQACQKQILRFDHNLQIHLILLHLKDRLRYSVEIQVLYPLLEILLLIIKKFNYTLKVSLNFTEFNVQRVMFFSSLIYLRKHKLSLSLSCTCTCHKNFIVYF